MKHFFVILFLAALGVVLSVPAAASTAATSGAILIRHEQRGCHTWSLNGGRYRPKLETRLARGGSITITNNDPMVHRLTQLAGRPVHVQHTADQHMTRIGLKHITGRGVMNHMGASVRVTFLTRGLHRFTTEDLGDYFELETSGEHNHLMLVVRVT